MVYAREAGQLAGVLMTVESMLELGCNPDDVRAYTAREIAAYRARMAAADGALDARIAENPLLSGATA